MAGSKKGTKKRSRSPCSQREPVDSFFTKGAIKRLGASQGVKRFGGDIFEEIKRHAHRELEQIILAALNDMKRGQKTLQARDVVSAVQSQRGIHLAYSDGLKDKVKLHKKNKA
jgi:histone H3/H4